MNQAGCLQQFLAYLKHRCRFASYEYLYALTTPEQSRPVRSYSQYFFILFFKYLLPIPDFKYFSREIASNLFKHAS